ncbi:MAG TPA: translocation/assembly module TamB domain-containing protein [Gemmatimonadales bacterium]|nr:translocation/assembly module TamB domain-containing protein [Gemmatimonadales bacterium]
MRLLRRLLAMLLVPVLLVLATVVGSGAVLLQLPLGRPLLARLATRWISAHVAGSVAIAGLHGDLWRHIALDGVVVRDAAGELVLRAPHLEAGYLLPGLLAGRLVFHDVRADSLTLHLVRLRADRWNYEAVFHLGEGPDDGKPPQLLSFGNLEVRDANIRIDVPTDDTVYTRPGPPRRKPASRNGRLPAQPLVLASADGPVRVYTLSDMDAHLRLLRVSTPRRDPILVQVASLKVAVNDPAITITQLAGTILTASDTLRFHFDSAAMPNSRLKGSGAMRWPHGNLLLDFGFIGESVALRDLWWIQPDFPDWQGSLRVTARSISDSRTEFKLENVSLGDSIAHATGNATVITDDTRGLGVRGLDLALTRVPIDILRPYLDTLPVSGRLTGHLLMDGFLDSLHLAGDLSYADALVPGAPVSHLPIDGVVHFGGDAGAIFDHFQLNAADIALGTVHQQVPSVLIPGVLQLDGRLNGPWKNATFVGTAEHVAPNGAVSRLVGTVRLDTRDSVLGMGIDADLDQLSFDALRTGYPSIPVRGGLTGHVVANGTLDSLELNAHVSGEIGTVSAVGRVRVNTPHLGATGLVLDIDRLDASAILGSGTETALNGRVTVTGVLDSGTAPKGELDIALDRSRFGGATVDEVVGVVHADQGLLTVDTGSVRWPAGRVDAHGTIGWAAPESGTLSVTAMASSLGAFDSLVRAATGIAPDTLHPHRLDGSAQAKLDVRGSRDLLHVAGSVNAQNLVLDNWHAQDVQAQLRTDSIDVLARNVGNGAHVADTLAVAVQGQRDSLFFQSRVAMMALNAAGSGSILQRDSVTTVRVNTLSLDSRHQRWVLAGPTRLTLADGGVSIADSLTFRSLSGTSMVQAIGRLPGDTPGTLDIHIADLDLFDLGTLLMRDTSALAGTATADLHLSGTAEAPVFNGSAEVTGLVTGGVHVPLLDASFTYGAMRLTSDVTLTEATKKLLDLNVSLPYDLALAGRQMRKVPGPITITGIADSVDLGVIAAVIPGIRNPVGSLRMDLHGSGTWDAPHLDGSVVIRDGGMRLPSLNVALDDIQGAARFGGDSMVIDSLHIGGGDGTLLIQGAVRFPQLTRPTLDIKMQARRFLAIDVPNYLTLRPSGDLTLTGSLYQPVLRSNRLTVSQSVLYFADLITKNVIDLEDPENIGLVDTLALRRQGLGNEFASRFLDSLQIDNVPINVGSEVWLRSDEANVQLEGQIIVAKAHKQYLLSGTLNAPRGDYTLRIGALPPTDFTVQSGTVRYSGLPDLNADLDIKAEHDVRTADGDNIPVVAQISGTMRVPKVTLSSPGRNLSERDLLSYMIFGRSEFQVAGSGESPLEFDQAVQSFLTVASGALSTEFKRSLMGSSTTLNTLEIRPGTTPGGLVSGSAPTQLAAGLQFGRRWFVSFDAGYCLGSPGSNFQSRNLGASVEYRINRDFRFQAAAEPVQTCVTNRAADVFTTLNRYQLGGDFLWLRDY